MYMKFLNVPLFLISLAVGLFVAYITMPPTQVIYVYPNPDNEHKLTFKDKADNCFAYNVKKVTCPKKKNNIKYMPVQMGNTKQKLPTKKVSIGNTEINKI